MQAHYETETEISASRQLILQLPDNIPPGKAKVAITYETAESETTKDTLMADFLASLPDNPTGGLSRAEIQTYLSQERQAWED
ncbi:MAG: hypothetical protein WBA17_02650 [Saprospiraceae bacterium]